MSLENPAILYPTLYAPATMPSQKLLAKMQGEDTFVRRFVVDTEDAVTESSLDEGLQNLDTILTEFEPSPDTDVFVRLRNPEVSRRVLEMDGVHKLTGFVLPKADPETFDERAEQILKRDPNFRLMPLLESPGMTDYGYRHALLDVLKDDAHHASIDCLRIGTNDLMSGLGMRRPESMTIYDTVVGTLISNIVIEYRGNGGFPLSAPPFENFGPRYIDVFRKEVAQHVVNQLFGQIVLHPRQLEPLWQLYKVDDEDLQHARYVTGDAPEAVKGDNGRLVNLNLNTHGNWAQMILTRADLFGVR